MNRRFFFRMRKLAQNIYFKPYFCLPDTFLAKYFIYALLRLAEKPAINFLKPAVSSKNSARGLVDEV